MVDQHEDPHAKAARADRSLCPAKLTHGRARSVAIAQPRLSMGDAFGHALSPAAPCASGVPLVVVNAAVSLPQAHQAPLLPTGLA